MKAARRFVAVSLFTFAQVGWASCHEELLGADIAVLPGSPSPGCSSDDPERPRQCDWRTSVQNDARLGAVRRLVLLNSNHETGSGSRQHLIVYGCVAGKLTVVLEQQYENGAHIEKMNEKSIVVLSGAWGKGDPSCCPSSELRQVFDWSRAKGRYVVYVSTRYLRERR